MNLLRKLCVDEDGFVISAELAIVATTVVLGLIVGLTALRDQMVQELNSASQAIGSLNQAYSISGVSMPSNSSTVGASYANQSGMASAGGTSPAAGGNFTAGSSYAGQSGTASAGGTSPAAGGISVTGLSGITARP
jgi:hypothetical protein